MIWPPIAFPGIQPWQAPERTGHPGETWRARGPAAQPEPVVMVHFFVPAPVTQVTDSPAVRGAQRPISGSGVSGPCGFTTSLCFVETPVKKCARDTCAAGQRWQSAV